MADMTIPIVLDVDTGTDDALAILYAVSHPDLAVLGISCVAGNSGLDQVVINTNKVLDAAGAPDIPVAAGARQPLIERARREGAFHGVDGLGGIALPDSARRSRTESAVEMLYEVIMRSPDPFETSASLKYHLFRVLAVVFRTHLAFLTAIGSTRVVPDLP